ncbi:MAG: DoxX family protein [Chlorobi bacterium]|nr:DoxX family protein [Chlorobiota bacterium]
MELLTGVVARILFSMPFLAFGVRHLMYAGQMGGMVPIPGGAIWVYITGIAMVLAGIAAITKFQGRNAMLLLALMLFIFVVSVQIPAMVSSDAMMKMAGTVSTYKDLGLMGGALLLAGIFDKESKKTPAA